MVNGLSTQLYKGWTEENQNTMVPQIRHTILSGQDLARDSHWITDASYLRGNLFSLGYTFNQSLISSLGLRNLRITANVENAFLLHSKEFLGYDPEGSGYAGNQQFFYNSIELNGQLFDFGQWANYQWHDDLALFETGRGDKDMTVYRYAEVLLIAAEAIARSEGVNI